MIPLGWLGRKTSKQTNLVLFKWIIKQGYKKTYLVTGDWSQSTLVSCTSFKGSKFFFLSCSSSLFVRLLFHMWRVLSLFVPHVSFSVPREGCVSWLWHFLGIFTYILNLSQNRNAPASVAQSDARPTSDQEAAGSTPAGSAIFFRGDWSWNIFYGHSRPSADSRRAVSGERKVCARYLED